MTPQKKAKKVISSAVLDSERRNHFVRMLISGLFILFLVAGVFVFANRLAQRTVADIPSLQEQTIILVDDSGMPITLAEFVGVPVAIFFGFTYCPDICPTTLNTLAEAKHDLLQSGVNLKNMKILFVTVDPERDTPEQLKQYLELFETEIIGLTGNIRNVEKLLVRLGIFAKKVTHSDGTYFYDHSAAVYLYRSDGNFKGTIVHNEPIDFIREKIKSLVE